METFKKSREYKEDAGEEEKSRSESPSRVAVPATGKYEKGGGDDGQDLRDDLEVVAPTLSTFPVDTLLEEIGLKIFGMLSDQDVASCFRAYPRWNQWLSHQRTQFLFPEYLPETALLNCRKVCRSWKIGLDASYQTHPYNLHLDSENWNWMSNYQFPKLINYLDSSNKITRFLQDMESHPGNPFPARNLFLGWDCNQGRPLEVEPFVNYWNSSVMQLLDKFGHQVHVVNINFQVLLFFAQLWLPINNLDIAQIFQSCLQRMPNLKNLEIQGDVEYVSDQLVRQIRMMQLPQLANLETVMIKGAPHDMIVSILESCCDPSKIKRVDFIPTDGRFVNFVYRFQNLEVLDCVGRLEDLARFRTFEVRPPLRKVALWFVYPDLVYRYRIIDIQLLFKILEVFAGTLKDVHLMMPPYYRKQKLMLNDRNIGFRVNLPNLETLWLDLYDGPLDPFIQLPSLKHLNVSFKKVRPWEGSAVQLHGFEERMENSNIWTLFPSLKTLTIDGESDLGPFAKSYDRPMLNLNLCKYEKEEERNQPKSGG